MQKSGLHDMKHHPGGSLKIIMLFSSQVSEQLTSFPVSSVLSLALCNYMHIFSGVVDIPAPSADNKRGGKPTSAPGLFPIGRIKSWGRGWRQTPFAPDRVTFVMATIIYSSSPPLFLAPRFWEPRDKPQPGFLLEARERTLGTRSCYPSCHHAS